MSYDKDDRFVSDLETFGTDALVTLQEDRVTGVYYLTGEPMSHPVDRLRNEEGTLPSCKQDCCRPCSFHIPMNITEAHALAQYIKRSLSLDQIDEYRLRTGPWHEAKTPRPKRAPAPPQEKQPHCPLLVDGTCSAYPARCRTHFVSSHTFSCWAINSPPVP